MLALLNPRLWIAAALIAALSFSHFFVYRAGKANVRNEWQAATAAANLEARKIEQHRETVLGVAQKSAASRAVRNRADSARSGDALLGLRNAVAARRVAEESAAAAHQRADSLGELFLESVSAYRELAETCDRHVNDVRLLIEAWPK
jgi:hypothetical protein